MTDGNMNEVTGVRTAEAQPGSGAASGSTALLDISIKFGEIQITRITTATIDEAVRLLEAQAGLLKTLHDKIKHRTGRP